MNNSDICRETIAKLMANENLVVTHSPQAKTASFNVDKRILTLPIWKDSDEAVYTLLISHEVGHALYTPRDELMVVLDENSSLRPILNIIEDCRIEKLIQNKYPGIRYQFKRGYMKMFNDNFFGTQDREADSYNFLDRLNIHFKVGSYGYYSIQFSENEMVWVDKIDRCETFSDVVRVAKELYDHLKQEEEQEKPESETKQEVQYNPKSSESSDITPPELSSPSVEPQTDDEESSANCTSENTHVEDEPPQPEVNGQSANSNSRLESETQNSLESNISNNLIDECSAYYNFKVPKLNFNDYIINYKTIHEGITEFYRLKRIREVYGLVTEADVSQFKNSVTMSVNSMANIFEMKKKASLYARTKVDKTGQIDMNRIHSYRYNDNIFKKLTVIPEGKSHGMVMFFDMSASMDTTISSCIEQILILCLFCKKINIPFDVYGFIDYTPRYIETRYYPSSHLNEMRIDESFKLRQYLSSKMTNKEFDVAFFNMLSLARSYGDRHSPNCPPPQDQLNGTPLVPCILMSKNVISKFKAEYNLDVVNAIYLTDGEDTHGVVTPTQEKLNYYSAAKIVIRSEKTNKDYVVKSGINKYEDSIANNLLKMVKDETQANIISFYLLHGGLDRRPNLIGNVNFDSVYKFYKANNFYQFTNHLGYDSFYIIKSNALSLNSDGEYIDADDFVDYDDEKQFKKNIKKIVKSFDKQMTSSIKNKLFLNKFIEQIA